MGRHAPSDNVEERSSGFGGTGVRLGGVLYRGQIGSACGLSSAAMGPFYCPGDQDVYLDLSFFQELSQRFGAPGDFARAYVIAHEIGHHVQNQLGLMDEVRRETAGASDRVCNEISVRQRLAAGTGRCDPHRTGAR